MCRNDPVKYWCTFFDPRGVGSVTEYEYMNLLEMMVRGKSYDISNDYTKLYALKIQSLFRKSGCLGPEKELVISKFEKALRMGLIKEIWFASAIGNRELILEE